MDCIFVKTHTVWMSLGYGQVPYDYEVRLVWWNLVWNTMAKVGR